MVATIWLKLPESEWMLLPTPLTVATICMNPFVFLWMLLTLSLTVATIRMSPFGGDPLCMNPLCVLSLVRMLMSSGRILTLPPMVAAICMKPLASVWMILPPPLTGATICMNPEWELHRAPPPAALREACGSVRCLLPPPAGGGAGAPAEWALPAAHSERQHAAKAVRCLLVAQRLRHGLVEATLEQESDPEGAGGPRGALPAAPVAVPTASAAEACAPGGDDSCPLHIAEEKADAPVEGLVVELGRQDRLVCELVLPEGRHTRYLVLHKFLLMLVQPDLVAAGSAVVRTSVPVRQVEPHVDRGDPRSLRLGLRLPRSTPCPGEARPYDPSLGEVEPGMRPAPEELRGSSLFTVTLAFEDTRRCRIADEHLRRRRGVARQLLQGRVEAFVEALCS
ncbi:unnamed protein product [Prorocentrum cordatum]|uniref:FACT complex subunit n=1 Tax=Prorocentrum cordatum TaxID=2364126 RepID=A0ABN9WNI3_9DINO|nr:unnamed protein product [Polarella glacialis]